MPKSLPHTIHSKLAIHGGPAVAASKDWVTWPLATQKAEENLCQSLHNKNWSVGAFNPSKPTFEERFCNEFAKFIKTDHVLTVDHGSNAILLALQALDIGFGDEVLIPGLTWVSCATAVLRVNAIPILIDIDPRTQCISPKQIEKNISPRTKAILVVHLNSCMADMEKILTISKQHGIHVIEDCAQAHGAHWKGLPAGSLGVISTFSTERSKLLTSGEGGIIATNDKALYEKMYILKNDGRKKGQYFLEEDGTFTGANFALSEFQSALLCEGLERLPRENVERAKTADYLTENLKNIPGIHPIEAYQENTFRAYFHYNIRFDPDYFGGLSAQELAGILSSELGFWVRTTHTPLNECKLFKPATDLKFRHLSLPKYNEVHLPVAKKQFDTTVLIHHPALLSGKEAADKIYEAFEKIQSFYKHI